MNIKIGDSNKAGRKKTALLPSISEYPSRKEWEDGCWQKISESKELLRLLITAHERHDLVMRAAALDLLITGKSYRQIGEELYISPQTISAIKKTINEKKYRSYLERSKKERKRRKYSSDSAPTKTRPRGTPRRTKYGTIYLP